MAQPRGGGHVVCPSADVLGEGVEVAAGDVGGDGESFGGGEDDGAVGVVGEAGGGIGAEGVWAFAGAVAGCGAGAGGGFGPALEAEVEGGEGGVDEGGDDGGVDEGDLGEGGGAAGHTEWPLRLWIAASVGPVRVSTHGQLSPFTLG